MNMRIQTLRGLACLLLVLYHVVGDDPGTGLRVQDGMLRWFNDGLAYLRMPLFTFLSGLVYGMRPFHGDSRAFLLGKARRLLVPMLVVGTLFAIAQGLAPASNGTPGAWYLLHLLPVAHFWFVESLFLIFVVIWVLECGNLLSDMISLLLVLLQSCAVYLLIRGPHWLSLDGAIYLMPYFVGGLIVSRLSLAAFLANPWVRLCLGVVAIVAVASMGVPEANPDRRTLAMLLSGLSLCLLCLGSGLVLPWLARLGPYSYSIYLFHVFFTASSRMALHRMGFESLLLDLMLGMLCGVVGPMLVERLVRGAKWPALLLLGRSVKGGRRAHPDTEQLAAAR